MDIFIAKNADDKIVHRKYAGKCLEDTIIKVTLNKYNITVGCTTITIDAAKDIMFRWTKEFEANNEHKTVVMQEESNQFPHSNSGE